MYPYVKMDLNFESSRHISYKRTYYVHMYLIIVRMGFLHHSEES